MPTPLPDDDVDLEPPEEDEVRVIAAAVAAATGGPGGISELQRLVLSSGPDSVGAIS